MNYYQFWNNDQMWNNWLVFREQRTEPEFTVRAEYESFLCPVCQKFDHDAIFRKGFDPNTRIRGRGDIIMTDDGFCCINEKVKTLIDRHNIGGVRIKRLCEEWYVLNISLRAEADENAYEYHKPQCIICKRWSEVTGIFHYESQIRCPKAKGRFFSTVFSRHCSSNSNRDIFLTGDVAELLRVSRIKGGMLQRLYTPEEESIIKKSIEERNVRWPSKAKILL